MSKLVCVEAMVWAPDHLTPTEVAEMVDDKLRDGGTTLVVDKVRVRLWGGGSDIPPVAGAR